MTNETQKAPRRYEKMRDSGVEWIGMVPSHWEIVRARAHFRQTNERGNQTPILLAASQKFGVCPQDQLEGVVKVSAGTDLQQFKTVHRNDFIISLRSFQGGFELSPFEGVCSPAYQVFRADDAYDVKYLRFLFKGERFIDHINSLAVGIRDGKNIKYSDFSNSLIILPPLNEQRAIAKSLSQVSAKIDTLIDEVKAGIEEYTAWKASIIYEAVTKGLDPTAEMKDSGVKWIREMPGHWERTKISNCFTVIGSGTTPQSSDAAYYGGNISWLQSGDLNGGIVSETAKTLTQAALNQYSALRIYKAPYIAIAMYGASIANASIIELDSCTNQACCVLSTPKKDFDLEYVFYAILSAKNELLISARGGTQPNISQDIIKRLLLPIPPLPEQKSIVRKLNQLTRSIDNLIKEKLYLIGDLESYKKSLIYEVVTGKRRVC